MQLNQILLEKAVTETRKDKPDNFGTNLSHRRRNAINKASRHLLENPYIHYENAKLLILSDSQTENGLPKFYETSSIECRLIDPGNFLCHAFWEGYPCWHRAAFEIVENYFEIDRGELTSNGTAQTVHGVNSLSPA